MELSLETLAGAQDGPGCGPAGEHGATGYPDQPAGQVRTKSAYSADRSRKPRRLVPSAPHPRSRADVKTHPETSRWAQWLRL